MPAISDLKTTAPMEVGLGCRDLALMRRFYEQALGLQFVSEARVPAQTTQTIRLTHGGAIVIRLQSPCGARIKLVGLDAPPVATACEAGHALDEARTVYLTFIVEDIAPVLQRLLAAGGTGLAEGAPIAQRPGVSLIFLRDPEGHVLELVQYDDVAAYRPDLHPHQPEKGH